MQKSYQNFNRHECYNSSMLETNRELIRTIDDSNIDKRSTITNYLRLLKLPAEILSALKKEDISMGHARALINVNNTETQLNIFRDAVSNKFTVREIEQIVKDFGNTNYTKTSRNRTKSIPTFEHQKISNDLSHSLGKEVKLKVLKSGKGKVEIKFNSAEELDEIIKKIS